MKRIAAIVLVSSIAFSGASMGYGNNLYNKGSLEKIIPISASIKAVTLENISIKGKKVDLKDTKLYEKEGHTMIPVRWILESLGYEVAWKQDLRQVDIKNGDQWASISIGKDSYFLGKAAPISLGIGPMLKEDRVYVPLTFIREILKVEYAVQGDTIIVESPNSAANTDETNGKVDMRAVIKKVSYDAASKLKEILVENVDQNSGTYDTAVVFIHEETQILKENSDIAVLEPGEKVELTFEEGPIAMIYPVRIGAKTIKVIK